MLLFLVQAVVISLTGVMAPGPITAVTVGSGTRSPHAGLLVALGHGLVEFPLMSLVYFGLGGILEHPLIRAVVWILGGAFLLFIGIDMLRSIPRAERMGTTNTAMPLTAGAVLSLGNAYFLIWWATVGASLLLRATTFGFAGVAAFALIHWSCDALWLYFLSAVSYRGGRVFGVRFQKVAFCISGVSLIIFGMLFLVDAGQHIIILYS